jgi:drug/metabolite transporter (DMT)-like permease
VLTDKNKGILFVSIGVFCFSIGSVLIKILKPFFTAIGQTFWRQLFVIAIFIIIFLIQKKKPWKTFSKEFIIYGIVALAIGSLLIVSALFFADVSTVLFLDTLYIIFNIIFSNILLGEKFSRKEVMLTLIGFSGAAILFVPAISLSLTRLEIVGMILAVVSAIDYSFCQIYTRKLRRTHKTVDIQFWGLVVSVIFLLPLLLFIGKPSQILHAGAKGIGWLATLGISGMLVGFYSLIKGMKYIRASVSGLVLLAEAPLATVFALALLGEMPNGWTLLGGGVILLAGGLLIRDQKKIVKI